MRHHSLFASSVLLASLCASSSLAGAQPFPPGSLTAEDNGFPPAQPAVPSPRPQAAPPKAAPPKSSAPALAPAMPAPLPNKSRGINVLILALDDLRPAASPASAPPAPVAPRVAPAIEALPPAITPAAFGPFNVLPRGVVTLSLAAKKPKPDPDADLFRPEPEKWGPRTGTPTGASTAPASQALPNTSPYNPTGAVSPFSPPPLPTPDFGSLPEAGGRLPGPSLRAAAPLRRALIRAGYEDVLVTDLDSASILRAISGRRLTPRVLDSLRDSAVRVLAMAAQAPVAAPSLVPMGAAPEAATAAAAQAPTLDPTLLQPLQQAASRVAQALGYRSVVVLTVAPGTVPARTYNLLIVDALREAGDIMIFDEAGASEAAVNEAAASTGASVIVTRLQAFSPLNAADQAAQAAVYLTQARAALSTGDAANTQDLLNQSLSLSDSSEAENLLGDLLSSSDAAGAALAYRRAAALSGGGDGATWGKIAIAHTLQATPDWPRSLEAANKALQLGYDTATLRAAMATAQFGRANLFRRANRLENAEDAEGEARRHLDRAFQLEPDNPQVVRLMGQQLATQGRYREAVQALDRLALQYPDDVPIQTQYATALSGVSGREEEAFAAWSRVWRLSRQATVPVDSAAYTRLAEGFDRRLANLGTSAARLSLGVSTGALGREQAILQLERYQEEIAEAQNAIKIVQAPPGSLDSRANATRLFSATLLTQALQEHRAYLETGQDIYRTRAQELHRQAIVALNAVRTRG